MYPFLFPLAFISFSYFFFLYLFFFFFFTDPSTTEIYTLSLHDALPIWFFQSRRVRRALLVRRRKLSLNIPIPPDRKSTRLNSSHLVISYAVFCLKKKKEIFTIHAYLIRLIEVLACIHTYLLTTLI